MTPTLAAYAPVLDLLRGLLADRLDPVDIARQVMGLFSDRKELSYTENSNAVVAKALHRLQAGHAPRIALAGPASGGKSSLVNALFGRMVMEVSIVPDTTKGVAKVTFPSGMVVYDDPGVAASEEYENITRAFLGMGQDPELRPAERIPIWEDGKENTYLPLGGHDPAHHFDLVLGVVNVSSTPLRPVRDALRSFFRELEHCHPGRVVVAGTHLDALPDPDERRKMLDLWKKVCGENLKPVSTVTGEGMPELVSGLFSVLPEKASLAKLQETLTATRRLSRQEFVVAEAADLLAKLAALDGEQVEEIQVSTVLLFAVICNHFAVPETTWLGLNGDALKVAAAVKAHGVTRTEVARAAEGMWEYVCSLFGTVFTTTTTRFHRLGFDGLAALVPQVYRTVHQLSDSSRPLVPDADVQKRLRAGKSVIEKSLKSDNHAGVAAAVRHTLGDLLGVNHGA